MDVNPTIATALALVGVVVVVLLAFTVAVVVAGRAERDAAWQDLRPQDQDGGHPVRRGPPRLTARTKAVVRAGEQTAGDRG